MIRPDEMPYRDGRPLSRRRADRLRQRRLSRRHGEGAGGDRRPARIPRAPARGARQGRYLGLGIASYVEGTGVGPFESAIVRIEPTGAIYVTSGACPQGQGMETIFAQVVADTWSVDPEDVVISLADTSLIAIGFGTIASRSTVTLSAAIHYASERLRTKVFAIAANMLECAPADLELRNGKVGVVGVPGMEVTLASVAQAARPGWDHRRPDRHRCRPRGKLLLGAADGHLVQRHTLAVVEVDIASGRIEIEQYVVAHDCGVVINPMLVEGQIVGGTVQGLGGALFEEFVYDRQGQLLTGSLMDYALPRASDSPEHAIAAPRSRHLRSIRWA